MQSDKLFGGNSVIVIGDPAQLPPVGNKTLYHSKLSTATGEQGYNDHKMFVRIVLSVIQRVIGSNHDQILFRELLLRLCNGEITQNDWKQLLRQPRKVSDIDQFKDGSHIIPMQK